MNPHPTSRRARILRCMAIALAGIWLAGAEGNLDMAKKKDVLDGLRAEHPRLLFTKQREEEVRREVHTDPFAAAALRIVLKEADRAIDAPLIAHTKIGKRLLQQTRASLSRIHFLAMAWRMTGQKKYLRRAEKEMLAAAALDDWNPSHFLDVAEMATGLAIGYDWMHDSLSSATRATVRKALVEKALQPGFSSHRQPSWVNGRNNWNQVCHTGLAMAALAMAEDEPQWAARTVERAVKKVPIAMKASYAPEGVYVEGPAYWGYGTMFNAMLIASLDTALGRDMGLSEQQGFLESATYHLNMIGPDGDYYRYSDSGSLSAPSVAMYWFAAKYDRPDLAVLNTRLEGRLFEALKRADGDIPAGRLFPLILAWHRPTVRIPEPLPTAYLGNGRNPVAVFRTSWDSADALWLAIKGGDNTNSHCHMDAGSFVLGAGGVRWSEDFGADNYTALERISDSLWRAPGRYAFFRLGPRGHSSLVINGALQEIEDSASPITAFHASPQRRHAVIDMSRAWRGQAAAVRRGAAMLAGRSVLIQDEITSAAGEIAWQMIAPEAIETRGSTATITKNGRRLSAAILSPAGAVFAKEPATPDHPDENQNEGFARLVVRIAAPQRDTTIAVHMWPDEGPPPASPRLEPLDKWTRDRSVNPQGVETDPECGTR